jgi:hypothetical protein
MVAQFGELRACMGSLLHTCQQPEDSFAMVGQQMKPSIPDSGGFHHGM